MIRWFIWLVAGAFMWAALWFLEIAFSAVHSGLGVADYGLPLMVAAVLAGVAISMLTKIGPFTKRGLPKSNLTTGQAIWIVTGMATAWVVWGFFGPSRVPPGSYALMLVTLAGVLVAWIAVKILRIE